MEHIKSYNLSYQRIINPWGAVSGSSVLGTSARAAKDQVRHMDVFISKDQRAGVPAGAFAEV